MNVVILTGYVANEPDLRTTTSGKSVCSFPVAVRRNKDSTDFFNVVAWEKNAEFASTYFKKGSGIEICGELTSRKYEDKNKNKRVAVEILARSFDFGKKSADENSSDVTESPVDSFNADDDLPF